MKVGMYVHWCGVGGAEDMIIDEIKYANRRHISYFFMTESATPWCSTHDELRNLGVEVYRTDGSLQAFEHILYEEKADILHLLSCGSIEPAYQAALNSRIPIVDVAACVSYSAGYSPGGLVYPVYLCKKHLEHGGGGKKEFTVITGGVDIERLRFSKDKREDKKRFGLDPDRPVFGWFGRFDQFKCPFTFVDIAVKIKELQPDAQFIMFGDGVDKGRTQYLADHNKIQITFAGFTREKGYAFNAMDVYVFPTWQEAFGRVMVEAMAVGTPIVTSNYPVCDEICYDAAFFVPFERADPMDRKFSAGFAEAAIKIFNDKERTASLSAAGIRRARLKYSADRMAKEFEALYTTILENNR